MICNVLLINSLLLFGFETLPQLFVNSECYVLKTNVCFEIHIEVFAMSNDLRFWFVMLPNGMIPLVEIGGVTGKLEPTYPLYISILGWIG